MSSSSAAALGSDDGCSPAELRPSRYESQKRRDWQTFTQYLAAHRPPLELRRCSGAHVLEFLRYLDRFGKTRVHEPPCPSYGGRSPSAAGPVAAAAAACQCPLRQAWGSLDALVGRLRAAYDERHGRAGEPDAVAGAGAVATDSTSSSSAAAANPFAARAVRLYLRDVRDAQAMARGISYHKKKKRRGGNMNGARGGGGGGARAGVNDGDATAPPVAVTPGLPLPPLPPCLNGVPFEYCDFGSVLGGAHGAHGGHGGGGGGFYGAGVYLPFLYNTFS
ncbi:protein G1 [Oryza sativa Japonica Group]|uniref:Protein G1 n=1 Tax=Oryza sativa subsp. japonica TaxID=39947 RepID=G1_ORYSJ|nr:protein G1 [Oryza sativa Japonica Group]Q8GVZ6.1 RecName: Full=Protein G1; AltName: Full=Protein ELONGATED EMPTY GLUME [Oryza sativa Japonica Group]KAB8104267.1 hypothetical protein EE612_037036 [Oryza sativa]ACT67591.1 elongated empty glume [Oryza sativa Japonica Group]KAF2921374.1 hypothetical protein DAI22_07g028100 [Oryza sativa Japonica Group]BAC45053.1 hypothetical protein [Oryza sativa Japonica Group]BAC83499.1 hypothetical protein [Oryza sativa Japonica Group]